MIGQSFSTPLERSVYNNPICIFFITTHVQRFYAHVSVPGEKRVTHYIAVYIFFRFFDGGISDKEEDGASAGDTLVDVADDGTPSSCRNV